MIVGPKKKIFSWVDAADLAFPHWTLTLEALFFAQPEFLRKQFPLPYLYPQHYKMGSFLLESKTLKKDLRTLSSMKALAGHEPAVAVLHP